MDSDEGPKSFHVGKTEAEVSLKEVTCSPFLLLPTSFFLFSPPQFFLFQVPAIIVSDTGDGQTAGQWKSVKVENADSSFFDNFCTF